MDIIWQLLSDPNIVYLLLVAGLLCTVLAFTTPGTGLPEAGAFIFLALALFGLWRLPTNWLGVGLILVSLIAFIAEAKWATHGAFTVGGVVSLTLGSLALFGIAYESLRVSIWLIALTVLSTTLFFVYIVGAALAMLGFFSCITFIIASPFAGVWVDRLPRRRVMFLADFSAGMTTIFLLVVHDQCYQHVRCLERKHKQRLRQYE